MKTENAIDAERKFLLEQLAQIRDQFEKAAKPYIDRLCNLEAIHGGTNRYFVSKEQWVQFQQSMTQPTSKDNNGN